MNWLLKPLARLLNSSKVTGSSIHRNNSHNKCIRRNAASDAFLKPCVHRRASLLARVVVVVAQRRTAATQKHVRALADCTDCTQLAETITHEVVAAAASRLDRATKNHSFASQD
jgi:hypothetical protein